MLSTKVKNRRLKRKKNTGLINRIVEWRFNVLVSCTIKYRFKFKHYVMSFLIANAGTVIATKRDIIFF